MDPVAARRKAGRPLVFGVRSNRFGRSSMAQPVATLRETHLNRGIFFRLSAESP